MAIALVTGASTGIGAAVAERLASDGHRVFAGVRDPSRLSVEAGPRPSGGSLTPVVLDVDQDASVEAAHAEVTAATGPVEILVSNAGIGSNATTEDVDPAVMAAVLDTNVLGAVRCVRAWVPAMREAGRGHVVVISSMLGLVTLPGQVPYVASKWALEAVAESLAYEVARYGVGVSIIEPGVIATPLIAKNASFPPTTAYGWAYRRAVELYLAGLAADVGPDVVADTVTEALAAPPGQQLRWRCGWAVDEILDGRAAMSDEEWVAVGAMRPDDYLRTLRETMGLDLGRGPG